MPGSEPLLTTYQAIPSGNSGLISVAIRLSCPLLPHVEARRARIGKPANENRAKSNVDLESPMQVSTGSIDPWRSAIAALMQAAHSSSDIVFDVPVVPRTPQRKYPYLQPTTPRPSLTVRIVERLTHCTVSIAWHDATACRYDDQIWRLGIAREHGICALTGQTVTQGDGIYRPINTAGTPLNHGAMILSSVIDHHAIMEDPASCYGLAP